jgi:CheY-like chemotaxis protein
MERAKYHVQKMVCYGMQPGVIDKLTVIVASSVCKYRRKQLVCRLAEIRVDEIVLLSPANFCGMTIWVTDDDPIFQFIIERFSHSMPQVIEVRFLANGRELLHAFEEVRKGQATRPGVVMLDLNMPEINGIEALRVMATWPDVGTLFDNLFVISSSIVANEKQETLQHPWVTDYYQKPIFVHDFAEMVLTATKKHA